MCAFSDETASALHVEAYVIVFVIVSWFAGFGVVSHWLIPLYLYLHEFSSLHICSAYRLHKKLKLQIAH